MVEKETLLFFYKIRLSINNRFKINNPTLYCHKHNIKYENDD